MPATTCNSLRLQSQVISLSLESTSTSTSRAVLSSLRRFPWLNNVTPQEQEEEEGIFPNQNEINLLKPRQNEKTCCLII